MNYDELIIHLNNNHFYPAKRMVVKNKSKVLEGLQVDCPPILKDDREKRLKEVIGEDYSVNWIPNDGNNYFLIKKK
jgi:hypothetical protein